MKLRLNRLHGAIISVIIHVITSLLPKNRDCSCNNLSRRSKETSYPDNKTGPLVIETPFLFSFGINESKSIPSGELLGYTLPVCLRGKDEEPTPEQLQFAECLELIKELSHENLDETYGVDVSETLRPILCHKMTTDKRGRKKRDETVSPVLWPKLIYSRKKQSIVSLFRRKGEDKVDPMLYFEKYCKVKLALIVDSIYISDTSVSIQVKVRECYVKDQKAFEPLLEIEESSCDEEMENYDTIR